MKKNQLLFFSGLLTLPILAVVLSTPANAHEPRDGVAGGAYNISVGHRVEPAWAKEPNAFDLFIRNPDDSATDIPVEDIDIEVYVLRLKEEAIDGKVTKKKKLTGALRRDFSTPNRYNLWYMPKKAGTYGFRIKGTIDGNAIDELFVCGNGTQRADGDAFGCVDNIQKF